MEAIISCNGNKNVANNIMGFRAFIAMGTTLEVDTHKVNRMCANT
jgi:hypothetical protein